MKQLLLLTLFGYVHAISSSASNNLMLTLPPTHARRNPLPKTPKISPLTWQIRTSICPPQTARLFGGKRRSKGRKLTRPAINSQLPRIYIKSGNLSTHHYIYRSLSLRLAFGRLNGSRRRVSGLSTIFYRRTGSETCINKLIRAHLAMHKKPEAAG